MSPQQAVPSSFEYLRARAYVARTLVAGDALDPEIALALTVWPTRRIAEAERHVNRTTIASRAYARRLNR